MPSDAEKRRAANLVDALRWLTDEELDGVEDAAGKVSDPSLENLFLGACGRVRAERRHGSSG